jgi:hypothetical protein
MPVRQSGLPQLDRLSIQADPQGSSAADAIGVMKLSTGCGQCPENGAQNRSELDAYSAGVRFAALHKSIEAILPVLKKNCSLL